MRTATERALAMRRANYYTRRQCDLKVGDMVRTPLGLTAKITGFGSDGRVHLRYENQADLVVLRPELLQSVADAGPKLTLVGPKTA